MSTAIIGAGYIGQLLANRLLYKGQKVSLFKRDLAGLEGLQAQGAEAHSWDLSLPESSWKGALKSVRRVVHLAPPPAEDADIEAQVTALAAACPKDLECFIYGSTSGAFGAAPNPNAWIDEDSPTGVLAPLGRRRWKYEEALKLSGLPLKVVRITGIYGPGRTFWPRLKAGQMVLFEGGTHVSRIHAWDLVRLLEAMFHSYAPKLLLACDDCPAPTLQVAKYLCDILGAPLPPVLSIEEAQKSLNSRGRELRFAGRKCRSRLRSGLIGPLCFPDYRTGLANSLNDEFFT